MIFLRVCPTFCLLRLVNLLVVPHRLLILLRVNVAAADNAKRLLLGIPIPFLGLVQLLIATVEITVPLCSP